MQVQVTLQMLRDFDDHSPYSHVYRKVNKTVDCLSKKIIGILDFCCWLPNFPKDVIKISYENYCGSHFNGLYKFYIQ